VDRVVLNGINSRAWMAHPAVRSWLAGCRLNVFNQLMESVPAEDARGQLALARLQELTVPVRQAMERLREASRPAAPGQVPPPSPT
jgi:hypothetical protein